MWLLDALSAVLVVAIGVATNQILNDGTWAWWWLTGDLVLAGAAAVVTHRASMARGAGGDATVQAVPWPSFTGPDGRPRTLSEVTPRDLGVHPNRFGDEGEAFYISRDVDNALDEALTGGAKRIVLVAGPRLAGATRTLARAARSQLPGHRVIGFADDPRVRLGDMIDQARHWAGEDQGAVLWLDGLTPGRLTELALTAPGGLPDRLWVLATVDSAELQGLRVPEQLVKALEEHAVRIDIGAVRAAERAALLAQEMYAHLRPILDEGTDVLMGRLMIAWDQIREALTRDEEGSTDRLALLHAITDWHRARLPRLLTEDVLDHLYRTYWRELAGVGVDAPVSATDYARALRWATTSGPDRPQFVDLQSVSDGHCYVVHPLLTAIADDHADPAHWHVHDALWRYADAFFEDEQRRNIGYTALRLGAYRAAQRLLDGPDTAPEALHEISLWLAENGDFEETRHWTRRVIASGHHEYAPLAMLHLGYLEEEQGRVEQARHWLEQVLATEHRDSWPWAMIKLGALEHGQGRVEQARHWYERLIATNDQEHLPNAMLNLAGLEWEQGREERARHWWEQAAVTGHEDVGPWAMLQLAQADMDRGRLEQARYWLERAAGTGHRDRAPVAMINLGYLEDEQGCPEQARHWWEQAAATGHDDLAPRAMGDLGGLEREQGRVEQARHWFERAIATGHEDWAPKAMNDLGNLERKHGPVEQARHWFERAVGTGHEEYAPMAMINLGAFERTQGRVEQARHWFERAIALRDHDFMPEAMFGLAGVEIDRGRTEQTRRWYKRVIATGHEDWGPKAMINLGNLEREEGRAEQARYWFGRAAGTGHPDVVEAAGQLLEQLEQWHQEQARATWFARYGWQAYADPALMHERAYAETDRQDTGNPPTDSDEDPRPDDGQREVPQ
ncbi:tetratricopeptide repeat protein [Actinomadura livida]|uniref:Tetratricopeptide (TPR) repeat protein n=1 Tax=Actinomadura livida TaxID=79909 RepID=A0A7W7MX22_9ACTN|nr:MULTISPECIES: tetratricopeptide repeat protein [Actinomadura]MBB4774306.1 tetratricopeptide (TPR) repeat protein [Actinomadura catellatispora]GGT83515.1 hypothetical protein GCM10010208_02430 [Actinomadura livida]